MATWNPGELRSSTGRINLSLTKLRQVSLKPCSTETPILYLPGLFAGDWIWDSSRMHLQSHGYRAITISDPLALIEFSATPIVQLRLLLKRFFERTRMAKAVLCGNSLGALAALDFAYHFPHLVQSLIISGSPGLPCETQLEFEETKPVPYDYVSTVIDWMFYDRRCLSDDVIRQTYEQLSGRKTLLNIARALRAARNYDVRPLLPHIDCPVLMVWGDHDRVTPVKEWEQYLLQMKRSVLKTIGQCGHCPMLEKPHEFNATMLEFLNPIPDTICLADR